MAATATARFTKRSMASLFLLTLNHALAALVPPPSVLSTDAFKRVYGSANPLLRNLRQMLRTAENSVVVGFTATPLSDRADDARSLLDIIKGPRAKVSS